MPRFLRSTKSPIFKSQQNNANPEYEDTEAKNSQCPWYKAVARLGFKQRATAVLNSNLIRSIEFGTAIARRLNRPYLTSP